MSDKLEERHEMTEAEATAKLREIASRIDRQYTINLLKAVERSMRKDSLWRKGEPRNIGCGISCCFMLVMLIGFTLSACMSWIFNHSVLWCILHSILGWLYVCYKAFWYVVTNH